MKIIFGKSGWAIAAVAAAALLVAGSLAGCAGGKQPLKVQRYTLEYPAPAFTEKKPLGASIRVDDFLMARAFETRGMVYRTKEYLYSEDAYNRWRVRPSEMVSDLFTRDLRNSGLFRGVFSGVDSENTRYVLNGFIEEFYEMEERDGSRAVLAVTVSLIDAARPEREGRTVFQKSYRSSQKMGAEGADPFVRAMSRSLETLSREIITEVYQAVRQSP